LVYHLIQNAGQVFTEARIRRFNRHRTPCLYCTVFLYDRFAGTTDGRTVPPFLRRRAGGFPEALWSSDADLTAA
jgi:hypothetical protein